MHFFKLTAVAVGLGIVYLIGRRRKHIHDEIAAATAVFDKAKTRLTDAADTAVKQAGDHLDQAKEHQAAANDLHDGANKATAIAANLDKLTKGH